MLTDPISDMLTRIRNAALARHERLTLPASRLKRNVAEILVSEGYISSLADDVDAKGHPQLTLVLKYGRDRAPAIEGLRRVSRPGRRVYLGTEKINKVRNGLGISVLSTSRGVMSDREARRHGVGGEILCEVW
jgi:small subunit ribosomal protein S8